jgi:hypothetical protein
VTTFSEGIGVDRGDATRRETRRKKREGAKPKSIDDYVDVLRAMEARTQTNAYFGASTTIAEMQRRVAWAIATDNEIQRAEDDHLDRRSRRRLVVAIWSVRLGLMILAGCSAAAFVTVVLTHVDDRHAALLRTPAIYITGASLAVSTVVQFLLKRFSAVVEVSDRGTETDLAADLDLPAAATPPGSTGPSRS